MKFGKDFHRHQVPEFASSYINYNALKRLFKISLKNTGINFTELFSSLHTEIQRVESFYTYHHKLLLVGEQSISHGIYAIQALHGTSTTTCPTYLVDPQTLNHVDITELRYLLGELVEKRQKLRKLLWYGRVNRDGLQRILQKIRECCESDSLHSMQKIETEISSTQFATQTTNLEQLVQVNSLVSKISKIISTDRPGIAEHSIFLEYWCATHDFPQVSLKVARQSIKEDDAVSLQDLLQDLANLPLLPDPTADFFELILLQYSIWLGSPQCIRLMLARSKLVYESENSLKESIRATIVKVGQNRILNRLENQRQHAKDYTAIVEDCDSSIPLLFDILNFICPGQQVLQRMKHYRFIQQCLEEAARYDLLEVCESLLLHIKNMGPTQSSAISRYIETDNVSNPLKLAVIGGHINIVQALLRFQRGIPGADEIRTFDQLLSSLLVLALNLGHCDVFRLLLSRLADVDKKDSTGQTVLYLASRRGGVDFISLLLERQADLELFETVSGWTPLIVASIEGHISVVETLLKAGADHERCDFSGWTAKDHALYRGHVRLGELLINPGLRARMPDLDKPAVSVIPPLSGSKASCVKSQIEVLKNIPFKAPEQILSTNGRETKDRIVNSCEIVLSCISFESQMDVHTYLDNPITYPDTAFSIEILAIGAVGTSVKLQLPILEDTTNKPSFFHTADPKSVRLVFNMFHASANINNPNVETLIGSGVALLKDLNQGLGPTKESLIRRYSIPVVAKDTPDFIGTVSFNVLVISPFSHPDIARERVETNNLWNNQGPAKIVGHRGMGQNVIERKYFQMGENTIESYQTALTLGASFVEFDVQVTKDLVPVIYHDFLVSETGIDVPIHSLSLEQFMYINEVQSGSQVSFPPNGVPIEEKASPGVQHKQRARSFSLDNSEDCRFNDLQKRMSNAFTFRLKGFKGNTRGNYIRGSLITLKEVLDNLPESTPLNLEIKYPMLSEATDDWKMDPYAMKLNLFVDTILKCVFDQQKNRSRSIMISSFSPEICILVSRKQSCYPVLFLNRCGTLRSGDSRARSLQEAVHFAKFWNLDGIVVTSEPLVWSPKLIEVAKNRGLVVASYGYLNNEPDAVKIQADAGVNVIIVDIAHLMHNTVRLLEVP